MAAAGDVNCDTNVNSVDALRILRYVAGLSNTTPEGCISIGEPLGPLTPQVLAAWIYAAPNDEARYSALLKVMELLRMGVYTSEGGEVQQGAERGPGDFYYYDFELRMMAASLGRADTSWGVQQIADTLDQVGYREDGQPFTAGQLNQILHDATNDSLAKPEEASSLVPMLVRELGLKHDPSYDLADALDVDEARFDPLQMTLILTALTLPVIADEGPLDAPASTLVADSNGILTAQPVGLTGPCSDFKDEGQELWPATKFFFTAVSVVSAVAKRVVGFIDIGHGSVLAFSVQVKALEDDSEGSTHYDHGPGDPGRNLKFRIEVRMLDDLGETLVDCGWLATADFPPKGPISGVRVSFKKRFNDHLGLLDHGTLDCTGLFCSRNTDANGIATLTFDPKSETEPYGQGIEAESTGEVEGIAWYQSRFRNIFGTLAQFVTPKSDAFAWSVRHHGCALEVSPQSSLGAGGAASALAADSAGGSVSIQAITSLDQLPCRWTGTAHASIHHYITGSYDEVGELDGTFTFGNPQILGNIVQYEIISGSATWQGTDVIPNICTFSDSGTHNDLQGTLFVTDDGSGHLTYDGIGGPSAPVVVIGCAMFQVNLFPFFVTCGGNWPVTGLDLSGSCVSDISQPGDPVGAHDEYEWHLDGISCSAPAAVTPGGTCGGP
jgi:hypothetical protein